MIKRTILAIAIPAILTAGVANAAEIYNKDGNKVQLYGKVVGEHGWTFADKREDNSNGDSSYARIGIKGETQISQQLSGYGQWEHQISAGPTERTQSARTRKAFAGLKFAQYGSLDYGRNTGVAYDGTAATDELVGWGNDSSNATDLFMTGRATGVLTYRNRDFFDMVPGLNFALQYQGRNNEGSTDLKRQNGDGFSTSVSYDLPAGFAVAASYGSSNRTLAQRADTKGDKAQIAAISAKYDANNVYAAIMFAQTYNLIPQENGAFANKTQAIEAVVQYQFEDFGPIGLRPSLGFVQSRGSDLEAVGTDFKGGSADMVKYIEAGAWYYFNKNMNVYAAYKFNLLNKNDYANSIGLGLDDEAIVGITYQF